MKQSVAGNANLYVNFTDNGCAFFNDKGYGIWRAETTRNLIKTTHHLLASKPISMTQ